MSKNIFLELNPETCAVFLNEEKQIASLIQVKSNDYDCYYVCDGLAYDVVQQLNEVKISREDLIETLLEEYDASLTELTSEISKILNKFKKLDFLIES